MLRIEALHGHGVALGRAERPQLLEQRRAANIVAARFDLHLAVAVPERDGMDLGIEPVRNALHVRQRIPVGIDQNEMGLGEGLVQLRRAGGHADVEHRARRESHPLERRNAGRPQGHRPDRAGKRRGRSGDQRTRDFLGKLPSHRVVKHPGPRQRSLALCGLAIHPFGAEADRHGRALA